MATYLDLVLSFIVGSMLIVMIMTFNNDLVDNNNINNMYLSVQENGMIFQDILRNDLKRCGLFVPDSMTTFTIADTNQVRFWADIDLDGSPNEVFYYVGDVSSAGFTENPNDIMLYRQIDSNPVETYSIGMLNLNFNYYDEDGNQTTVLSEIKEIEYTYNLESTFGYDEEYPGIYIEGRIKLKNVD